MSATLLIVADLTLGSPRPAAGTLSFQIDRGERLGVWGPGGCGKSALLRAIAREGSRRGDHLRLDAEVFAGRIKMATRLTLAYHEQQPVRPHSLPMTVRELLDLAGASQEPPPRRMETWLLGRVDDLTVPQFQLLQGWIALAGEADLILMDEPDRTLDAIDRALLADLTKRQTRDRGILIASQDRSFLDALCHRVVEVGAWR